MASASDRMRNNVRAGVFVLVTLLLIMAVIFLLGDVKQYFAAPRSYVVTYPVESGVKNLSQGSVVRVGGINMGRVSSVRLITPEAPDAPARMIEVSFTLSRDVHLFSNAGISVQAPLIGSEAWLDITSLGGTDLDPEATLLTDGQHLAGAAGGTMLDTLLGANARRVDNILTNVESGTEFFAALPALYDEDFRPILKNVEEATDDARSVLSDLNDNRWHVWADQVSTIMTRATALADSLDQALASADGLIQDGRTVIGENRESIRRSMENLDASSAAVQEITARVRDETIDKVHGLLATGQDGLDQAVAVLNAVSRDYDVWSTDLSDTMSNASLASQQLKIASVEIRRSPWKVLYRPSADELEHELLYEAARSFALAASDLKAASIATQRMLDNHADQFQAEPELVKKVTKNLLDPLEQYERAQLRLFEVLKLDQ
jgi:ABC-type transporter Mla subunit MlaD